jgi:2,3-bisphosphoglycerate-dependent phosphoglycerate mutase
MRDVTELVLVRHGEAVVNLQPSLDGVCLGLTERGRGQARQLRERFAREAAAGLRFDVAYHSPRARAVETAAISQPGIGIPFLVDDELRTADHGEPGIDVWDAATNSIRTIPPLAPDQPPTPGAESWQHFLDRSGAALLDLAGRHQGQRILIVGHGETTASAMQAFLRLSPGVSRWAYPLMYHTAITTWRHVHSNLPGGDPAGQWQLVSHNDASHVLVEE